MGIFFLNLYKKEFYCVTDMAVFNRLDSRVLLLKKVENICAKEISITLPSDYKCFIFVI